MVYSYTQIRQYLTCPRRYRLSLPRQLAGEGHPSCHALRTCIRAGAWRQEDPVGVRFREWSACQNLGLYYSNGDAWERMLQQDIMLLDPSAKMTVSESINRGAACRSSSRDQSALVHKAGVDLGRFDELSF